MQSSYTLNFLATPSTQRIRRDSYTLPNILAAKIRLRIAMDGKGDRFFYISTRSLIEIVMADVIFR